MWDTMRYGDTVNERAVRILLECILVFMQKSIFLKLCGISTIQLSFKNQIKSRSGCCFCKREGNCLMTNENDDQSFCKILGDSRHSIFLSTGKDYFVIPLVFLCWMSGD